jgi:hypothetical protein
MLIRAWMFALSAFAVTPCADAQVLIGGGVGYRYAMYPAPVVPPFAYGYPYYGGYFFPDPLRFEAGLPSCYRFGRCSLRDVEFFRDRPHRLDRLAPTAPKGASAPSGHPDLVFPGYAPPTPEANIQPEYRGASQPREEFSGSGQPREPAAAGQR